MLNEDDAVPESESMKEAIVIDVKKSKNCKGSNQN
jgi:hypothetical protein